MAELGASYASTRGPSSIVSVRPCKKPKTIDVLHSFNGINSIAPPTVATDRFWVIMLHSPAAAALAAVPDDPPPLLTDAWLGGPRLLAWEKIEI